MSRKLERWDGKAWSPETEKLLAENARLSKELKNSMPRTFDGSRAIDASFNFKGIRAARMILVVDQDEFPALDATQIFEGVKEQMRQNVNFACDITASPEDLN